jgi:hypothetical protein
LLFAGFAFAFGAGFAEAPCRLRLFGRWLGTDDVRRRLAAGS